MTEHPNCQAIERFVKQFGTSVKIGKTERIDNERVQDGYVAAHMNNETGIGVTAVSWTANDTTNFRFVVEGVGTGIDAVRFGALVGKIIE